MDEPWQYGADILVNAVFCFVVGSVYTLIRKIRGQDWNSAIRKSFRDMGIFFVLSALGILSRMGRHNVLAVPWVRILFAVLAIVFWIFPVIWFIRIIKGLRKKYDETATEDLLRLSESKWVVVSMILAMIFTVIPIFSH